MKLKHIAISVMATALSLLAGCGGGSYSGVEAVAPGTKADLNGSIPGGGQYSVYRASGFSEGTGGSSVEKVWTVSANGGERLGFRWSYPNKDRWAVAQPPHLIAFAGSQTRDLGPFRDRNVKYVWAGTNGDVVGYFNSENAKSTGRMLTMQ